MKHQGPELGDLSSRFFAYAQLRKKDIIRTGELGPVLGIKKSQEHDLLRRLSKSGWIVRLKRGVYLVPARLPAGGKYSPGVALILRKLMEEQNGKYQICGPTAFNFYGFEDQIPTVTYVYNNRLSGARTIGNFAEAWRASLRDVRNNRMTRRMPAHRLQSFACPTDITVRKSGYRDPATISASACPMAAC